MPRPGRFTPGKDPVPTVQEAGLGPVSVWTGARCTVQTFNSLSPANLHAPCDNQCIFSPSKMDKSWDLNPNGKDGLNLFMLRRMKVLSGVFYPHIHSGI